METADLSWLAAKQKRVKSWQMFLKEENPNSEIKTKTEQTLKTLSEKLLQIWETKSCSEEDKYKIEDLERILEQLNEEARFQTQAKVTI